MVYDFNLAQFVSDVTSPSDYEHANIVQKNVRDARQIAQHLRDGGAIEPWSWQTLLVQKVLLEWADMVPPHRRQRRGRKAKYNAAKLALIIEQARNDGLSLNKAMEFAAEKLAISIDAVKKATRPYRAQARKMLDSDPHERAMTAAQHDAARKRYLGSGPLVIRDPYGY